MNSQELSNEQKLHLFSKKAEKLMSQISLLSILSRVTEKVFHLQTTKFLND